MHGLTCENPFMLPTDDTTNMSSWSCGRCHTKLRLPRTSLPTHTLELDS